MVFCLTNIRFSFVFPNTALTTATFAVDLALNGNRPIQIIGCALAIFVVLTWVFVFTTMLRAVILKQILWPQKQEDRNEGGWQEGDERLRSEDRAREARIRRVSAIRESWRESGREVKTRTRLVASGRELSQDRADYAIKEAVRGPMRGRASN
jgi:hypothetical protein